MKKVKQLQLTITGHKEQELKTGLDAFYDGSALAKALLDAAAAETATISSDSGKGNIHAEGKAVATAGWAHPPGRAGWLDAAASAPNELILDVDFRTARMGIAPCLAGWLDGSALRRYIRFWSGDPAGTGPPFRLR